MENDTSLEDLVARLFDSEADNEIPLCEKKRFFLTKAMLDIHHEKLVETIVAMANYGRGFGMIFCSGKGEAGELVDAELIDAKMRSVTGPAVRFTLERRMVANRLIDLISIPISLNRPHMVLDRNSGRFYFPIRGAANNATMARADLEECFQERFSEALRRAYPSIAVDSVHETTRFAQLIGYGLEPLDKTPQVTILVIPESLQAQVSNLQLAPERPTDRRLFELMSRIVNLGFPQYYTTEGFRSTKYGEDYCEIFEAAVRGEQHAYMWGNRTYFNGTTIRRVTAWQIGMHGAWTLNWLENEIEASIRYAALVYDEFEFSNVDKLRIMVALKGVLQHELSRPAAFGWTNKLPRRVDEIVVVPERSDVIVSRSEILARAKSIAENLSRIVGTFYS